MDLVEEVVSLFHMFGVRFTESDNFVLESLDVILRSLSMRPICSIQRQDSTLQEGSTMRERRKYMVIKGLGNLPLRMADYD